MFGDCLDRAHFPFVEYWFAARKAILNSTGQMFVQAGIWRGQWQKLKSPDVIYVSSLKLCDNKIPWTDPQQGIRFSGLQEFSLSTGTWQMCNGQRSLG